MEHAHTPSVESVERYERLKRQQELIAQRNESDTKSGGNSEDSSEHGVEIEEMNQSTKCTGEEE